MDVQFIVYLIAVCIIALLVAAIIHTVYKIKLTRLLGKKKRNKTLWYSLIEKIVKRKLPKE
ncbi:hypothetical protein GCM10008083_30360 [Ulvibacter litoralis]|nr:hypothetical protein GCM10008083_30360 [Ulvibacter litoralis]